MIGTETEIEIEIEKEDTDEYSLEKNKKYQNTKIYNLLDNQAL